LAVLFCKRILSSKAWVPAWPYITQLPAQSLIPLCASLA
jgi:hypothetical protein